MTQSNYQNNAVDLDSIYIPGNDPNYVGIQSAISARKTVVFGQQLLTQTFPIGNVNNAINYVSVLPPRIDQDSTTITGVGPTSVFYKNRTNPSQSLIRANFGGLLENTPQINTWYYYGTNVNFPNQVGTSSNWAQVACGYRFSLALSSSGTLYGWGTDTYNLQTSTVLSTPTQIGTTTWSSIACGYRQTLALQSTGTLWAWGYNTYGEAGTITSNNLYSSPVQVTIPLYPYWVSVASPPYAFVGIQSNGTMWACGYNGLGQLGLGDTTNRSTLVQIGTGSNWASVSAGGLFCTAIQSNGTLWAWGKNQFGALGLGDTTNRSSPVQVGALTTWKQSTCSSYMTWIIKTDGTLWGMGNGNLGMLGNNSTTNASTPIQIGAATNWAQINASGSNTQFSGVQSNGTLWAFGLNSYGNLGTGDTVNRSTPSQIGALTTWTKVVVSNFGASALQNNGTLWAWGNNSYGQLGQNNINQVYSSPVQVGNLSTWANLWMENIRGILFAVQSNGTLWGCGYNGSFQLGTLDQTSRSSLIQIGTASTWVGIGCGYYSSFAVQNNGYLYSWGSNSCGQLGNNTFGNPGIGGWLSSPVQTLVNPSGSNPGSWTSISAGYYASVAIQSNGTLWAWGQNNQGQLGLNDTANRSYPVQVGIASNWSKVTAGYQVIAAIQSNGTLWAWGYNANGQLGLGDTVNRSTPAQVGAISSWSQVSCSYTTMTAIQSNGTLWSWGNNPAGQLGINSFSLISNSSPVQVGALSSWTRVGGIGRYLSQFAIQSNGTLWGWGGGTGLGLNTNINKFYSPVQIGTSSSWSFIISATWPDNQILALQSNGTLWSWGSNSYSQLGLTAQGISATKITYGL